MAHTPTVYSKKPGNSSGNTTQSRGGEVCANSTSQVDQSINNVRARLLGGGDCWWNNKDEGRYIVPKVDPTTGALEVSSIFAGSVWIGGVDPGGNLKLAAQTYRNDGRNDFWSGPLNAAGVTDATECKKWDRHFRVTGEEIRKHLANLAKGNFNENDIPRNLRGWPAQGNPYFTDIWGFELPNDEQGLAGFYDAPTGNVGVYDPLDGDYPSIEIRNCPLDRYPDEMIFWIYNDQGGGQIHARTMGRPIQMEVQVQAFGYTTNDELNDMTFQRYKLINRATTLIDSCFFAMWVDPDLGCFSDDYIGCDTSRQLMYVYNQDAQDGQPGCTCPSSSGPVNTYCETVPILGVDYFRGPRRPITEDSSIELGMSSFTYYNNGGVGTPPPGTDDPNQAEEYYNYITGSWRDGNPFTYGGNGKGGTTQIKYAFTEAPNNPAGWSMCTANLPFGDRRTLQASGPFLLKPGAVNELIIGVPWVADQDYPCPDLEGIFRADQLAQGLFNNCFKLLDGPDAPDVDWIETNEQIIAVLTNPEDSSISNNAKEQYSQADFLAPDDIQKTPAGQYRFEGYRIYQLINPNVSAADYENAEKSRIVAEVDIKNGISKIYNWVETRNPFNGDLLYYPELKIESNDAGIRHTFSIIEDKFAPGNDKSLINHKKYYYSVVAYAYNNYENFDPTDGSGQKRSYLPGRRNIQIYTVIPRPVVDQVLNTAYGDGIDITRLEGAGSGGNFLDFTSETRAKLLNLGTDSTLTYKGGNAPINVTIFNPFEVKDGDYEIALVDANTSDTKLEDNARWELKNLTTGEVVASSRDISTLNEQIVPQFGFSVTIVQSKKPQLLTLPDGARLSEPRTDALGATIEYANPDQAWLTGVPNQESGIFNYVKNNTNLSPDYALDPTKALSSMGDGLFVPYYLCDTRLASLGDPAIPGDHMITPGWTERTNNLNINGVLGAVANRYNALIRLPSVDIVLTSDTSKWSRCMVVESASSYYTDSRWDKIPELSTESESTAKQRVMFDTRYALSVGKVDANGDGLPDPDGAVNPSGTGIPTNQVGTPVRGMGWFPGYAVDVETGRRLNIFFGENSCFSKDVDPAYTGRDMLWNPTDQVVRDPQNFFGEYHDWLLGGHHYVYVTYSNYDGCEALRRKLTPELNSTPPSAKVNSMKDIAWAGMLFLNQGYQMKSLREGLVPSDAVIKLRMDNPYQTWSNNADDNKKTGHPRYQFSIKNRQPSSLAGVQIENALDSIKVVPNPYYGYSQYETSQFSNVVKITNLPGKCTVTIYSLDGKFIRQYQRNESYAPYAQISPALEWDLKNNKNIPVASGVYLIHVSAEGLGERTIKWFGIARQFDPSGL